MNNPIVPAHPSVRPMLDPPLRSHVVQTGSLVFQAPNRNPHQIPDETGYWIESKEMPYQRELVIGEEWTPLDLGWLKDKPEEVGLVLVQNLEGAYRQVIPTDEEKAETARRVVELRHETNTSVWLVRPGRSFRGCSANPEKIALRCRNGSARIVMTIFPE